MSINLGAWTLDFDTAQIGGGTEVLAVGPKSFCLSPLHITIIPITGQGQYLLRSSSSYDYQLLRLFLTLTT